MIENIEKYGCMIIQSDGLINTVYYNKKVDAYKMLDAETMTNDLFEYGYVFEVISLSTKEQPVIVTKED